MKFIDLFSGIGGFRLGMEMAGHRCVGHCEIDKFANKMYKAMHSPGEGEWYAKDIRDVRELPDADCYCGGFPCQSFSVAGRRGGFQDTRGTLFFEIMRLARARKPKYLFLENVSGLLSHDAGGTFATILQTFTDSGYDVQWQVLNSKDFGVPQNRERVFFIGHRRDIARPHIFPIRNERWYIPNESRIEKVYLLQKGISKNIGIFLRGLSQQEEKEIPRFEMQRLLTQIKQGIQEGTCREVQRYTEEMDTNPKRCIQISEELNSWASGQNNTREICGVVSIPTEDMLLLWHSRTRTATDKRCLQQQNISTLNRQSRFYERLRRGEFSTLLLAVQSYQGRLFYSIGNGRDWTKIYSKEVGECKTTLSSILEDNPDPKYFLSEEQTRKLLSNLSEEVKDDITGTSVTLASQAGGMGAKTGLYMIPTKIYSDSGQGRKWRGQDFVSALRVGGDVQCVEVRLVLTPDRAEKRQNGRRFKEEVEIANTLQVAGPSMGCGNNNPVTGVMITDQCKEKMLFKCDCGCESIIYDLSEKCPHCNSIRKGTVTYLNQRAILSPKRTEYGKQICKNYESGEIKESRHNTTKSEQRTDGVSNTLSTVQKDNLLLDGVKIRRLTPRECFRLQGFPDEYFDRAKAVASDTQLYKAAGNAVTVNVIYEIAKRL